MGFSGHFSLLWLIFPPWEYERTAELVALCRQHLSPTAEAEEELCDHSVSHAKEPRGLALWEV